MAIAINGIAIEGVTAEEVAQKLKESFKKDHKMGCLHSYTEKTMNLRWGKRLVEELPERLTQSDVPQGMRIGRYVPELEQMEVCQTCGKLIWVPVPTEE